MIYSVYIHISAKWWHVCIYCDFFYPKSNLFFSVCFPHSLKLKGWPSLGRRTWREMGGFEAKPSCSPPQDQFPSCGGRLVEFVGVVVIYLTWHHCDVHILCLDYHYLIIMSFDIAIYRWDGKPSHGTRRNVRLFLPNLRPNEGLFQIVWSWPRWYLSSWWAWLILIVFCLAKPDQKLFSPYSSVLLHFFSGRIKLIYVEHGGKHQLLL